ncbi:hypothetical protein CDAR_5521 [Caerostris darwini]|uniref:Uncharacterized protein n=1 Tax=Caerostris darwini TaxID=1538125 RepID=A0AAV4PNF9_9ARAC|nr:hypothetical protein CDAR_5521 [Caerostris darwini]
MWESFLMRKHMSWRTRIRTNQPLTPPFPLTLRNTCNHITADIGNFTSKSLKDLSGNIRWKCLTTEGSVPIQLERTEAVAHFCLTNSHDYLQTYIHRIHMASNVICLFCQIVRLGLCHLKNYTELIIVPEDTVRYWKARRLMAELP